MTMETLSSNFRMFFLSVVLALNLNRGRICVYGQCQPPIVVLKDPLFQFASNFEYMESEFYFWGALGRGLDSIYPELAFGGPPPIGARKANLDPIVRDIIEEFGYGEVGNLRKVIEEVGGLGIKRPLLNLSKEVFSEMFDKAFGYKLDPPFDPYANTINYLLTIAYLPYTGQLGLVGGTPPLLLLGSRKLAAALLAIEAGQSSVVRTLLYQRANESVAPYNITVAEFVNRTAVLVNKLGKCGTKDEGLFVPQSLGAENRIESNVLPADSYSLSFLRYPQEILRILYGTGNEGKPGAILPEGAHGVIAQNYIRPGIL